jgi:DNA-binding MarR family transcriptional regulator
MEENMRELRLFRLFHRCSHLLHHQKRLYPGQGRILILLRKRGTMTQRELMDLMEIRSASLSELTEKMEQNGFIARSRCEQDRRNIDLSLTEKGMQAADEAEKERAALAQKLFGGLSDEDAARLEETLNVLCELWTRFREEDGPCDASDR